MNPYAFVVGCPRSGTTLVGRIAAAHPQLAVVHESRWIPRLFEAREGLTPDGLVTAGLVDCLRDSRVLGPLELGEDELEEVVRDHEGRPFARLVTTLYDRFGERRGKRHVGDKSPGYVRYLPTLHRLWPGARLVHVVRDGRDVCLSALDWGKGATRFSTFEADPLVTVGVWWEWYVRLGREGSEGPADSLYHELRYESLVAEPEHECAVLSEALGLPFDAGMLRFHQGRTRTKPGLSAKSAWLPVTKGLRDWRRDLDADSLLRFESAAGALLEELGYGRGAPSIPARLLERAAAVRAAFAREAIDRGRPVPRAWAGLAEPPAGPLRVPA